MAALHAAKQRRDYRPKASEEAFLRKLAADGEQAAERVWKEAFDGRARHTGGDAQDRIATKVIEWAAKELSVFP